MKLKEANQFLKDKGVEIELRKKILEKLNNNILVRECTDNSEIDVCQQFNQSICKNTLLNFDENVVSEIKRKTGLNYCDLTKLLIHFVDRVNEYNQEYAYVPQLDLELTDPNLIKNEYITYKRNLIKVGDGPILTELIMGIPNSEEQSTFYIDWIIENLQTLLVKGELPESLGVTDKTKSRIIMVLLNLHKSITNESIEFALNLNRSEFDFLSERLSQLTEEDFEAIYENKQVVLQNLEGIMYSLIYTGLGGDTLLILKKLITYELNELVLRCLFDKYILHFVINECFGYIFEGYISKWNLLHKIFNMLKSNIIPSYFVEGSLVGIDNVYESLLNLPELRRRVNFMRNAIGSTTYRYLTDLLI
jgi:hypothetical protein